MNRCSSPTDLINQRFQNSAFFYLQSIKTQSKEKVYQRFLKKKKKKKKKATPVDPDEGAALTSLKVTFLLAWGSSTIFCKFAATEKRDNVSVRWQEIRNMVRVCTQREGINYISKRGKGMCLFFFFKVTDLLLSPSRPPGLLTRAPGTLRLLCLKNNKKMKKLWQCYIVQNTLVPDILTSVFSYYSGV